MNVDNFATFDPFAENENLLDDINDVGSQQNVVHLRLQQRNGRKTLTIIEGLPKEYELDPDELSQVFKNEFKCGGSVVKTKGDKTVVDEKADEKSEDKGDKQARDKKKKDVKKKVRRGDKTIGVKKMGGKTFDGIIQLQGDHRTEIQVLLVSNGFPEEKIMIHGT